jgi:ABC-type uncharacterized transport system permease subunit
MAELLFWPALLGYGEAAIAYTSSRHTRLATWGVRIGWLAQTGLLVYQASRVDGFPWASWAGSLNLFVWFTVGAYLIWGCQARYRLVGLTVMPLVVGLFIASRVGGGTTAGQSSHYSNLFLTVHVGCVLAAFAGFTLAASLATLYLLEERGLNRHSPNILRLKLPSLVVLEKLTVRTIAISLPLLTIGLVAGFIRLREEGKGVDTLMAATIFAWVVYAGLLALRAKGRRTAYLALIGFAIVLLARIVLAGSHF